jgi:hypothetical protein
VTGLLSSRRSPTGEGSHWRFDRQRTKPESPGASLENRTRHDRGFPDRIALRPGESRGPVYPLDCAPPEYSPFHLLLSVPVDYATIERLGAREGWLTGRFGRGPPNRPPAFHVIGFWRENRLLIELSTRDMLADYIRRFGGLDAEGSSQPRSTIDGGGWDGFAKVVRYSGPAQWTGNADRRCRQVFFRFQCRMPGAFTISETLLRNAVG